MFTLSLDENKPFHVDWLGLSFALKGVGVFWEALAEGGAQFEQQPSRLYKDQN